MNCIICGAVTHTTSGHRPYYDDDSAGREAYLKGWQKATLGTDFPITMFTGRCKDLFVLGWREAHDMVGVS